MQNPNKKDPEAEPYSSLVGSISAEQQGELQAISALLPWNFYLFIKFTAYFGLLDRKKFH
jgi:hypothetical protein